LISILRPTNTNQLDDVVIAVLIKLASTYVADFKKHLTQLNTTEQQNFQTSMRLSVQRQQQQQQQQQQQEQQTARAPTKLKLDFSKFG